jgi:sterol 3beta-glucosyltransferase
MRITLIAFGSRGDVQPHIALGAGLQTAGNSVRVVTHTLFEPLIRSLGLEFSPVEIDPRDVVDDEAGQDWLGSGTNFLQFFQHFSRIAEPLIQQAIRDCWHASQGSDMLVFSPLAIGVASSIAEKLGVPYWIGAGQPLTPTRACAIPFFPQAPGWLPFGRGLYHRSTYLWSAQLYWRLLLQPMNKARREVLDLQPLSSNWLYEQLRKQAIPMLYYFSPTVLPRPADWNERNQLTGYWYLEDSRGALPNWRPSAELVKFLATGQPSIYVGFGSMHSRRSMQMTKIVLTTLEKTKQRAVLATGWGGIGEAICDRDLPENIFVLDYVPHDWLFPQLSAVVHHGGAGTMAAAVRAGIPAVIIPFFGDQPFWGQRFYELGVTPAPIPQKRLTVERLARAIQLATNDETIHTRMQALSEHIREEHGVRRAIEIITAVPPTLS